MIYYTQNKLWNIPRCDIYATIMSDLLHQIKSGLWLHLMNMFEKLILHIYSNRQEAHLYLDEVDKRITLIPQFLGIKSFPNGIRNLNNITAREYEQIMKVFRCFYHVDIFYYFLIKYLLSRYIFLVFEDFFKIQKRKKLSS